MPESSILFSFSDNFYVVIKRTPMASFMLHQVISNITEAIYTFKVSRFKDAPIFKEHLFIKTIISVEHKPLW